MPTQQVSLIGALESSARARGGTLRLITAVPVRWSADPITGNAVARMLKCRAELTGLNAGRITRHSLHVGYATIATTAATAGVGLDRIAAQTRHSRIPLIEH